MSNLLTIKQYEEGEKIFSADSAQNEQMLVFVISGAIKCKSNGAVIKDYELIFNDQSNQELFEDDVIAENYTITAEISSKNIKTHFGSEVSEIIDRSQKIKIIKSIYLFSLFSEEQLLKILSQCQTMTFN